MQNMSDLIDAMVVANDAVAEAGNVARKARGVADAHKAKGTQATEAYYAASAFTTSKRAKTALAAEAFVKAMRVEAAEAKAAEICAEKAGEAAAKIADALEDSDD